MNALAIWHWLTGTIPGAFVLYGLGTALIGLAFKTRSDAEWNELKALRWPWRAYLFWARFWAFLGATARTIGVDGPKASRLLQGVVFARHAVGALAPSDDDRAPPLASTSVPPHGPPPGTT